MSYTIHVRIVQTNLEGWWKIEEKTVWNYAKGGNWSENRGEQILTMNGSGTSGMLRLENPQGDSFLVALGVHNYKRWCDVIVDAGSSDTAVEINQTYYAGSSEGGSRNGMIWKQLASIEKTSAKGVQVKVNYIKEDNTTFWATIVVSQT